MKRIVAAVAVCLGLVVAVRADQKSAAPAAIVAEVSGVVRASAGGPPAVHAMVLIAGTDIGLLRVTSTDAGGHFNFTGLPAGRFLLGAGKPAYLAALYGAGRPGRPGTEISLTPGQKLPGVTLDLLKGAVISGHVVDDEGQAVVGARVRVLPRRDVGDEVVLSGDAGDPSGAVTRRSRRLSHLRFDPGRLPRRAAAARYRQSRRCVRVRLLPLVAESR